MSTKDVIAELLQQRTTPIVAEGDDASIIQHYTNNGKVTKDRCICLIESAVNGQPIMSTHSCSTTPPNLDDAEKYWVVEHFAQTGLQVGILRIIMMHGKPIPFNQQNLKLVAFDASSDEVALVKGKQV